MSNLIRVSRRVWQSVPNLNVLFYEFLCKKITNNATVNSQTQNKLMMSADICWKKF